MKILKRKFLKWKIRKFGKFEYGKFEYGILKWKFESEIIRNLTHPVKYYEKSFKKFLYDYPYLLI